MFRNIKYFYISVILRYLHVDNHSSRLKTIVYEIYSSYNKKCIIKKKANYN